MRGWSLDERMKHGDRYALFEVGMLLNFENKSRVYTL